MEDEFEHKDPFGPKGWARRMVYLSLTFLFAMMFYMRSCYPDMERACDMICEADGHDYGEIKGFWTQTCSCYNQTLPDQYYEKPLRLP